MPQRVLILGSSGMAGHVLTRYLSEMTELEILDVGPRRKTKSVTRLCDLEDVQQVTRLIYDSKPSAIVNCTGILVKASELRQREAVWFNAYLPHLLSESCNKSGIRLLHLSTDCVFSGRSGPYSERAYRDGDAFYDRSKSLGEIVGGTDLTIRTSIIGPELRPDGTGLFDWIMHQRGEISGYRKALWSGVTTLELAKFIRFLLEENWQLRGLVHYSVSGGISKYELLSEINRIFERGLQIIPIDQPVIDKRLISTRTDLGKEPEGYLSQLAELKEWISSHEDIYFPYMEQK